MAKTDLLTPEEMALIRQHAPRGLRDLDGFAESLRILVEIERYSLTDIGAMFGVSRERARQLCIACGIPTPRVKAKGGLFDVRLWIDSENRFAPAPRKEVRLATVIVRDKQRAKRRADMLADRHASVRKAAEKIRAEGRDVTIVAVAREIFGKDMPASHAAPRLRSYWHMGGAQRDPKNHTMQPINEACGIPYKGYANLRNRKKAG